MTPAGAALRAPQALRLAARVFDKSRSHREQLGGVWDDLQSLARMLRAWAKREYAEVPWRTLAAAAFALTYFVNPLDAVPDFLPAFGLVDDVTVIAFVVGTLRGDLQRFVDWEKARRKTTPAAAPTAEHR